MQRFRLAGRLPIAAVTADVGSARREEFPSFGHAKLATITSPQARIIKSLAKATILPVSYQTKVRAVLDEVGISKQVLMLSELQDPDHEVNDAWDLAFCTARVCVLR